jgi:hypothetical protein
MKSWRHSGFSPWPWRSFFRLDGTSAKWLYCSRNSLPLWPAEAEKRRINMPGVKENSIYTRPLPKKAITYQSDDRDRTRHARRGTKQRYFRLLTAVCVQGQGYARELPLKPRFQACPSKILIFSSSDSIITS